MSCMTLIIFCCCTLIHYGIVSDWTKWSAPDATGSAFRYRMVTRPAINGGKECPELIQARKGIKLPTKHQ
jgi:hypothetical protein